MQMAEHTKQWIVVKVIEVDDLLRNKLCVLQVWKVRIYQSDGKRNENFKKVYWSSYSLNRTGKTVLDNFVVVKDN